MRRYIHYASKGFVHEIMFANEEEFIAGMNRIAVCIALCIAAGRRVNIIAFCLMDNHFHFILHGTEEDCSFFVDNYARLTAIWITKHRDQALIEKIITGYWYVSLEDLPEKIIYVFRNPQQAKMKLVPHGYRWSSAFLTFSDTTWMLADARKVADISIREIRKITSSHVDIPGNWLVLRNGMIWPGCYTATSHVEKQFPTVQSFMYSLNNHKVDQKTNEEMAEGAFSLPDAEVRARAKQLGREFFQKMRIAECSADERLKVARLLRKELKCNTKQLARVLHLTKEALAPLL